MIDTYNRILRILSLSFCTLNVAITISKLLSWLCPTVALFDHSDKLSHHLWALDIEQGRGRIFFDLSKGVVEEFIPSNLCTHLSG